MASRRDGQIDRVPHTRRTEETEPSAPAHTRRSRCDHDEPRTRAHAPTADTLHELHAARKGKTGEGAEGRHGASHHRRGTKRIPLNAGNARAIGQHGAGRKQGAATTPSPTRSSPLTRRTPSEARRPGSTGPDPRPFAPASRGRHDPHLTWIGASLLPGTSAWAGSPLSLSFFRVARDWPFASAMGSERCFLGLSGPRYPHLPRRARGHPLIPRGPGRIPRMSMPRTLASGPARPVSKTGLVRRADRGTSDGAPDPPCRTRPS